MLHTYNGVKYAAVKKNGKDLYELIWSDFQNILLKEKSKMQKNTYSTLPFV